LCLYEVNEGLLDRRLELTFSWAWSDALVRSVAEWKRIAS